MQVITFAFYLLLLLTGSPAASVPSREPAHSEPAHSAASRWASEVAPIFAARCQPCHFSGGVMYQTLPFDDPATIRKLGKKTFSRIRDEKERALISAFLAENDDPRTTAELN